MLADRAFRNMPKQTLRADIPRCDDAVWSQRDKGVLGEAFKSAAKHVVPFVDGANRALLVSHDAWLPEVLLAASRFVATLWLPQILPSLLLGGWR